MKCSTGVNTASNISKIVTWNLFNSKKSNKNLKIFNPAHDLFTTQALRLPSPWSFKHKIINSKNLPKNFDIFNPPPPPSVVF